MKAKVWTAVMVLIMGFAPTVFAQPYSLDENIKPLRMELKKDKKVEGASYYAANITIKDSIQYMYVTGCSMYQLMDVYIFSNFGNPDFRVDLVKDNWGDIHQTGNTGSTEKGIINFKLRAEGDFGLKVYPANKKVNYTLLVYAGSPVEAHLGSAFRKADASELKVIEASSDSGAASGTGSSSSGGNTVLYIVLGVALLVIGFLAARLMNRKTAAVLVLLLSGIGIGNAQVEEVIVLDPGVEEVDLEDIRNEEYMEWLRDEAPGLMEEGVETIEDGLDRLEELGEVIRDTEEYRDIREIYDLYESYAGLGNCINSAPPPGMPRIPSFCETDDCGTCFVNARETFNQNRYSFEKLKTIYRCTKNFTDRAIAFGDNASGVHGVSGLAWQVQKNKIEKSVKELQKAYDQKYVELLQKQKNALIELSRCEARHGIPDWFDRFGYMYYEFTAMNYKRAD